LLIINSYKNGFIAAVKVMRIKNWKIDTLGNHVLSLDDKPLISMVLDDSKTAELNTNEGFYKIQEKGFLSSTIIVEDTEGGNLFKLKEDRWLSPVYKFDFKGKKYQIKSSNNPVRSYQLTEGNKLITTYYEKSTFGESGYRVIEHVDNYPLIFDGLIWFMIQLAHVNDYIGSN
jgi:hypothetical protein